MPTAPSRGEDWSADQNGELAPDAQGLSEHSTGVNVKRKLLSVVCVLGR